MLTGKEIDAKFSEFIETLQNNGEIITEAIMFFAYINPHMPRDTMGYGQAIMGDPPLHHCLGLIEVGKDHLTEVGED